MKYLVYIIHSAYGIECACEYTGSELGAKRLANKLAKDAGHGWEPRYKAI